MERKNWDEYFMGFAKLAASRSGCLSRNVGCVIVQDNRIIATGYNAAPQGIPECIYKGECRRQSYDSGSGLDQCFAVHAEQNALAQCAKYGIPCDGATMYVTTFPCSRCMKMIINSGIKRLIYLEDYNDEFSKLLAMNLDIWRMNL